MDSGSEISAGVVEVPLSLSCAITARGVAAVKTAARTKAATAASA